MILQAFAFLHAHVVSHDIVASHLAHHITIRMVAKAFTTHVSFMDYLLSSLLIEMVFSQAILVLNARLIGTRCVGLPPLVVLIWYSEHGQIRCNPSP
jgi:hypothetical protein